MHAYIMRYGYTHAYIHAHGCMHTYIGVHDAYTHACIHAHGCMHTYIGVHDAYTHAYIHAHGCMHTYIGVHDAYTHACIHTYIHSVDLELQRLSDALIKPIAEFIPEGVPICVIPHAHLHVVPFCALPMPNGEPLGMGHALTYAPSLSALKLLLDREAQYHASLASSSATCLVVGNPALGPDVPVFLPAAGEEAESVATSVGAQPEEVLIGAAATLDAVLERLKHEPVRLIHLAAQSSSKFVNLAKAVMPDQDLDVPEQEPEPGSLLLNDDLHLIWLQAHPTVVLAGSSCSYGDLSDDWVLGLPRTFLISGARSVVASLWGADDTATATLMAAFYSALRDQPEMTQAAALSSAQQHVRNNFDGKWSHPFFWAGFTLVGAASGI